MESQLRQRRTLQHAPPSWVKNSEVFFITLNGSPRGFNQFANRMHGPRILDTADFYHSTGKWYCHLLVVMPDHLHLLASFPGEVDMTAFVLSWKRYLSKTLNLRWQRDFFDHRIRNGENLEEKTDYIRQNPVRAGLAAFSEDWPYVWEPKR